MREDAAYEQKLWVLESAARPMGFHTPHAASTVELLHSLAREGLVRESEVWPCWYITDAGRAVLRLMRAIA